MPVILNIDSLRTFFILISYALFHQSVGFSDLFLQLNIIDQQKMTILIIVVCIESKAKTMLIPRFSLSQTTTHLIIVIRCPYVKFSSSNDDTNSIEVDLPSPDEFYFACKPYHLHLYLPGRVIISDVPEYEYDIDTSSFHFKYEKEIVNEHFQDLDMITKLLHREKKISSNKIEEIDQIFNDNQDTDEPLWNQMRQLEIDGETKNIQSLFLFSFV